MRSTTGDEELLRLAHLLRLCGDLTSSIGRNRDADHAELDDLAAQTLEIARRLDSLVLGSRCRSPTRTDTSDRRH